ncbi:glutathione S-transferase family protein, partial [Sphingomonas metalli]|uniref:glutathione S-transferase family protein n=1 Tax=Sphingomonas metalli TaxID=1779358 RepID=UPI001E3CAB9D
PDRGPFHVVITPRPLAYFYTATVAGFCSAVDTRARARVDEAVSFASTDVRIWLDIFSVYPTAFGVPAGLSPATVAEMRSVAETPVRQMLSALDDRTRGGFVVGEALTIADFLTFSYVTLAELVAFDIGAWPSMAAWLQRMKALPAYGSTYAAFQGLLSARTQRIAG